MQRVKPGTERSQDGAEARLTEVARAQAKFTEVYQERCTGAVQRYVDAVKAANESLLESRARPANPVDFWRDASAYWLDFTQRSILFWDTLRQRGNNWLEHEKAGKPPLLDFDWEMVADARTFERPANYALVQIIPPEGARTNPDHRPFVIIDPRAGHGPGIGGFKQDSQVGVALKAGHPVYCVIFFPEPVLGQTLADVSRAEAEFLRIVGERHPKTRKPVVIGNCQGGWASMLIGALEPDLVGPIVINGAPMSYWAGNDVENLFVGNNLADGDAEWSEGRAFDLRAIQSPIILFASLGDNITPPQQAFNWVVDLYPTTEALKANGQVIVGLMHKSVGHLGIFVSGAVAKREHTQIVDLIEYIESLPPGLYSMQVEEQKTNGSVRYDVLLTERRVGARRTQPRHDR